MAQKRKRRRKPLVPKSTYVAPRGKGKPKKGQGIKQETVDEIIRMLKSGYKMKEIQEVVGYSHVLIRVIADGKHPLNRTPVPCRWRSRNGITRKNKRPFNPSENALKKLANVLLLAIMKGKRYYPLVLRVNVAPPKELGKCVKRQWGKDGTHSRGLIAYWWRISKIFDWIQTKIDLPYTGEEISMLEKQVKRVDSMFGLLPEKEDEEDFLIYDLQLDLET